MGNPKIALSLNSIQNMQKHYSPTRPSSQSGFALPVTIGLGLIAVLIGLTAILRAQDDRSDAANNRGATQSKLAAESGIAQTQSFINRYRMLANFNACNNDNWNADGSCNDSGSALTDISWGNPALIPNLNAVCGTGTLSESQTAVSNWTTNTWKPVDTATPPDLSLGEYRLMSYDSNGTLSIEGISKRGEPGESRTRLTAQLPIFDIANEQLAGLWVGGSISGNPVVNTDIVSGCNASVTAAPASGKSLIRTQLQIPSAPALPSTGTGVYDLRTASNISGLKGENLVSGSDYFIGKQLPRLYDLTVTTANDVTELPVGDELNIIAAKIDGSYHIRIFELDGQTIDKDSDEFDPDTALVQQLDDVLTAQDNGEEMSPSQKESLLDEIVTSLGHTRTDDVPNDLGVYQYIVDSIDESFELVAGKAVDIWVTGDTIDLSDKGIINPCNAPGATLSCGPFDIRIYGTGSSLNLNAGTALCDVFFHMPGHNVTFASGGSTSLDCGGGKKNTSIFWVNNWTGADGSNSVLEPRATWSQALSATSMSVPPPRIGLAENVEPET